MLSARAGNYDIYAQKIDSSGNILWTSNGVAVCSKTTAQKSPKIVDDNAGGAYIVWEDSLNFYWDIYAQHINSNGTLAWASGGVSICSAPNLQSNPRIDVDGLGGAIITWQDKRNNFDYDIYAQRINSSGVVQWTANGISVCGATNNQSAIDMKYVGSSGLVLSWKDERINANEIYTQLVSLSGIAQLASNGIKLSNALKSLSPNVISAASVVSIID